MNTTEPAMTADCDMKKMELGAPQQQQQQQPPQDSDAITKNNLAEAVAVQVLDGRSQQGQQGGVVIEHHYIVSSPAPSVRRNNGDVQCCYPVSVHLLRQLRPQILIPCIPS